MTDALLDSSPGDACANPILFDNFTQSSQPCAPWGSAYADLGAMVIESSRLVLTPSSSSASVAGCFSNGEYAFGTGLMASVSSVITGPDVYTVLQIHGALEYRLVVSGDGRLHFQTSSGNDIATAPYSPTTQWWRIRPSPPSTLAAEYSTDRQTWTNVGAVTVAALPATVGIELAGGTNISGATGSAVFDQLVICP